MKRPSAPVRKTATTVDARAGCFVCHGSAAAWTTRNALSLAARHHDRTGHPTWCDSVVTVRYGAPTGDDAQTDIEDALRDLGAASGAAFSSGGEPDAAPLPVPYAPAVAPAGVSASSAAHRDMPFNGLGARGSTPETIHV